VPGIEEVTYEFCEQIYFRWVFGENTALFDT